MVVGQKTLKDYDIESLSDYFEIIIESEINGHNREQTREYYKKLSKEQRREFIDYLKYCNEGLRNLILKTLEIL